MLQALMHLREAGTVRTESADWPEWDRLFDEFTAAIAEIMAVQVDLSYLRSSQATGLSPFNVPLETAVEKKRRAKDALLLYIDERVCR